MLVHVGKSVAIRLGAFTLALTALTGCYDTGPGIDIPATLRTPMLAGVVREATQLPEGQWRYQLDDGRTVDIDYRETTSLYGGPAVGRLLLWGTDADGTAWVLGLSAPEWAPECFRLSPPGRANDGWIETNSGFRLRKSAEFRDARDRPSDEYGGSWRVTFCLNGFGEVTEYRWD